MYASVEEFLSSLRWTVGEFLGSTPAPSGFVFDSDAPGPVGGHAGFDTATRLIHLSPERTRLLRRQIIERGRTAADLSVLTTVVHELVHSASPVLAGDPLAVQRNLEHSGFLFWEEGLASWWAQKVASRLLFGGEAPEHARSGWRSYQHYVGRIQWLEETFGEAAVKAIWHQSTSDNRILAANRLLRPWLESTLRSLGLSHVSAARILEQLGDEIWHTLRRGYYRRLQSANLVELRRLLGLDFGLRL